MAIQYHLSWQFTLLKNMAYTLGMITKEVTWLDSHVRKLSLNINQQIGEVTREVQWKEKWIIWKAMLESLDRLARSY